MSFDKYKITNLSIDASGSLSTSGAYGITLTVTDTTDVTLPVSGTLLYSGGALGEPLTGTLTNCTSLPISTGISGLGANVATFLATPSSANLASAVTDETGSGALVFGTSPSLTTPDIGVATATSINKLIITAPASGSTLTIADGKTLTCSNTLTLQGTDSSTLNIGTGGTLGTAAFTASTAYQSADAALTSISGLTYASASFIKLTAEDTYAVRTIAETKSDLSLNNVTNESKSTMFTSPTFTTSVNLDYSTASELVATDGSKNLVSLAVATYPSLTELSYVKGVTSAIQTQINNKQSIASTRYAKGNISGAVSIDYDNGDYQVCTTTATVTGITISNLATETGMILLIDNSGGYSVTFGGTEIIASTDTGVYACVFYNDNGTIYFYGKGERQN